MLCVWSASEQHHPDTETPSPTRVGNPRTVFAALAPWVLRDTGAIMVATAEHHSPASGRRRDRGSAAAAAARPFQHLQREPPRRSPRPVQPCRRSRRPKRALRAKVRAVARPMLQSVSVTMQSLRTSRPDISVGPGGRSGEPLIRMVRCGFVESMPRAW
jgi:hypothetical protein